MPDQPRFLARGLGYTENVRSAMDGLEAVDASEQARQTSQARRRAELEHRQEWLKSRERIRAELDHLRELFGSFVAPDLRVIRHHLDKIDTRVRTR